MITNSAYEEMYIDLYNTINIYMINYNIIFFVVRIGSRGYSYNIFNLQVIIIRFSLSETCMPGFYLVCGFLEDMFSPQSRTFS
jgi:hypothetical protein